ncbi:hypothetical protein SARC_04063 [Sphaeroforma arctica JP610]|uniref:EngB-type G domain-containing protein n=1 Tax=Sphaeroforma arctica JP610 TaxID=667725 RepID=A0A0L0G4A5_9EUKA|nr:hypothetical protein SARC_04063 [Sphaeroforma arctica JP610]KNC83704.1 hypothetical protein SARC_04063 [Sphaeroforma arctica JP610]|eukprot:XP_014157606.1 hypothetical protein SARC_04063 [Sphaeroforma arctica JP610]
MPIINDSDIFSPVQFEERVQKIFQSSQGWSVPHISHITVDHLADAGAPRRNPTVAEMANNEFSLLDIARQYDTSVPAVVPQKPKPPPQGNGERERQSERRARDARQYTSQKKPPPPPPRVNPPPSGVNRSSRRVALKNAPILPEVEKRLQRVNLLQQTGRVRRAARAAAKSAETGEITPAEKLFEKKLLFKGSAAKESELPRLKMDEIAFVGRSNVGKSSLLNALAGPRGNPAVVEDKPGTTRCANFYAVQKQMCLVDLPGYGFAYADTTSKEQGVTKSW